ncbi:MULTISPECIES: YbaN family protein [unclassified Pseudomonas]|uniref:YbaN family protein n=1 Tax=unclassified Pseudomonas TaxID=196821 RepID=UPI00244B5A7F|nr:MULTISPECIES: YbaN family protein [unclassified Pseudomonas]MDG9927628.1 YbaN family protein [Pseudomonas sp. GD04042]MDH0485222.1 YbaN family protein [Pseudomonas sp. GD04015]MDH0603859.1 YbaN family protein [Pseudomonas sp. GD03869]
MSPTPRSRPVRLLYALLAYTSLGVGLVGLVLPGLPTTEFVLLAAWAASRSSPRLSRWLENHRLFGPILANWRNGKAVARRAKVAASLSMLAALAIMLITLPHGYWLYAVIAGMAVGNLWIWSRPDSTPAPRDA